MSVSCNVPISMQGLGLYIIRLVIAAHRAVTKLVDKTFINLIWLKSGSVLWGCIFFYSVKSRLAAHQRRDTVPPTAATDLRTLFTSVIWGLRKPSALFSFPMTSVRGGRQDLRGTRSLIGQADGNTLKVRSAWGIDHRPRPVPRWELCWRSFKGSQSNLLWMKTGI